VRVLDGIGTGALQHVNSISSGTRLKVREIEREQRVRTGTSHFTILGNATLRDIGETFFGNIVTSRIGTQISF